MTALQVPQMPSVPVMRPPPPVPIAGAERRMTLVGVRWETYVRLCDDVGPGTRITYDCGRMEIVMPSHEHEDAKTCLARIVEAYSESAGIAADGVGQWTVRREDLARGLEPDECYYVANAAARLAIRRQGRRVDLSVDPPPDLAIEIDISPPEVAKPPIYAALGVPEIWRCDGRAVTFLARQADGQYVAVDRSLSFPNLPLRWVNELLALALVEGQLPAIAELRRRVAAANP